VRRGAFLAELRTLHRVRDYLARGRPLASLPLMGLRGTVDRRVPGPLRARR